MKSNTNKDVIIIIFFNYSDHNEPNKLITLKKGDIILGINTFGRM